MPLMRVGADTREHWDWPILRLIGHQGRPSAKVNLGHTFARSLLDGTLLLNDPDVVFCRGSNTTLADSEKFLIALSARMFASQILTSDDPSEFGPSEREFTGELLALFEKLGSAISASNAIPSRIPTSTASFRVTARSTGSSTFPTAARYWKKNRRRGFEAGRRSAPFHGRFRLAVK